MRKLVITLAVASLLAGIGAAFAVAGTRTVGLHDNFFSRHSLRIHRGTRVTWRWIHTRNPHNVTAIRGARFHSRTRRSGSFSFVFRRRGTYTIICTRHPTQMRMRIRVI